LERLRDELVANHRRGNYVSTLKKINTAEFKEAFLGALDRVV